MSPKPAEALEKLTSEFREIATLGTCEAILSWDEVTYMPQGGAGHRANQKALIAGMFHKKATAPQIGEWLSAVESSDLVKNGHPQAANVRELRRQYNKLVKLPESLVTELTRVTSLAHPIWVEARKNSDFKSFLPSLERIIELCRQKAEAIGYREEPYDALLDDYEPNTTSKEVERVFTALRAQLVPVLERILGGTRKAPVQIVERNYPMADQQAFAERTARAIGYNFASGRLDVTTHPFCTQIGPGDVRITTRYNERHFNDAFFGVLHEAGHGIYEQNLKTEEFGLPTGEACSLGIHESQSRLWENFVGRSKPFWEHFFPAAKKTFPEALGQVSVDDFYFAVNDVRPSFIRVEADEVTYNLHIMLRFELELALIRGDLKAKDAAGAWNETFKRYLGLQVKNDAQGCLQDVHWSAGLFGYFPTYALGNLYAAQFFAAADSELGGLHDQFRRGSFEPLRKWLSERIHVHGRRYPAPELVARVTGKPLSAQPLLGYLEGKFYPLYGARS
jgi:carboxypeptidase Taq